MPPAPKSKVVPKFEFDQMSDNSHNSDGAMHMPPPAKKGGFDFGLDNENSDNDE